MTQLSMKRNRGASRGAFALEARAVSARPASCDGRKPSRSSPIQGTIRPATTGSKFAGMRNSSNGVCDSGNAGMVSFEGQLQSARSGSFPLHPLQSPYESVRGTKSCRTTAGSKQGRRRRRTPRHDSNMNLTSVRSILPWFLHQERRIHVDASLNTARGGEQNDREKSRLPNPLANGNGVAAGSRYPVGNGTNNDAALSFEASLEVRNQPCVFKDILSPKSSRTIKPGLRRALLSPTAPRLVCQSQQHSQQQRLAYADLLEAAPPQVPGIDQYILSESLTYEAINKRGHTEALPVDQPVPASGLIGAGGKGSNKALKAGLREDAFEDNVDPDALLFPDQDIEKVLSFLDRMGNEDGRVTLEEMIAGFRKIRREWATVKAEEAGRAVIAKIVRLMERAGMTLDTWFKFMDSSQGGQGDGKLTGLELRHGFARLAVHIARRECCCRAYRCQRTPTYGPPAAETASETAHISASASQDKILPADQHQDEPATALPSACTGIVMRGVFGMGVETVAATTRATGQLPDADRKHPTTPDDSNLRHDPTRVESTKGDREVEKVTSKQDAETEHEDAPTRGAATTSSAANAGIGGIGNTLLSVESGTTEWFGRGEASDEQKEINEQDETPKEGQTPTDALTYNRGINTEEGDAGVERAVPADGAADDTTAGKPVFCRGHALEGMVHLGARANLMRFEDPTFSGSDINELMRFIDTNVNFDLDIEEIRDAICRLDEEPVHTSRGISEAGSMMHTLERHMHSTGARFTDLFFSIDRDGNGFIEEDEMRALFARLSREPARQRERAKLRAQQAQERARLKEEQELQAREAFVRLEAFKKAGVYAVFKRIEVWQARCGRRLGDAFNGAGGDRERNNGLDADELAAFLCSLELNLTLTEAMSILRFLDTDHTGSVEIRDVSCAVRQLRRDEGILRSMRNGANINSSWPPGIGDRKRDLDGAGGGSWVRGGGRDGMKASLATYPSSGPSTFRPPVESIIHNDDSPGRIRCARATSAPAHGRVSAQLGDGPSNAPFGCDQSQTDVGDNATQHGTNNDKSQLRKAETIRTVPERRPMSAVERSGALPSSKGSKFDVLDTSGTTVVRSSVSPAGTRTHGEDLSRSGGFSCTGKDPAVRIRRSLTCASPNTGPYTCSASSLTRGARHMTSNDHHRTSNRPKSIPPEIGSNAGIWDNPTGCLEGEGVGCVGWWPGALSAVENGSRVDIYAGSVLDGAWLESLDYRLGATMRATRR